MIAGKWYDPYTDQIFTDPSDLDIDHLVPLAEAFRSERTPWSDRQRMLFANDMDLDVALIAVSKSANRSKRDKDPANWLPPNVAYHCEYAKAWIAVKRKWDLKADEDEAEALRRVLGQCPKNAPAPDDTRAEERENAPSDG